MLLDSRVSRKVLTVCVTLNTTATCGLGTERPRAKAMLVSIATWTEPMPTEPRAYAMLPSEALPAGAKYIEARAYASLESTATLTEAIKRPESENEMLAVVANPTGLATCEPSE